MAREVKPSQHWGRSVLRVRPVGVAVVCCAAVAGWSIMEGGRADLSYLGADDGKATSTTTEIAGIRNEIDALRKRVTELEAGFKGMLSGTRMSVALEVSQPDLPLLAVIATDNGKVIEFFGSMPAFGAEFPQRITDDLMSKAKAVTVSLPAGEIVVQVKSLLLSDMSDERIVIRRDGKVWTFRFVAAEDPDASDDLIAIRRSLFGTTKW